MSLAHYEQQAEKGLAEFAAEMSERRKQITGQPSFLIGFGRLANPKTRAAWSEYCYGRWSMPPTKVDALIRKYAA